MTQYLSDTPIETSEDDRYGVAPFAQSIAKSILDIDKTVGTVIALNGAWGCGKSSIVNLVRKEIEKSKNKSLSVTEFKCWWFRGEEALVLAFLQHIDAMLRDSFGDKAKGLIGGLCRTLLQATPTLAPAIALATGNPWLKLTGDGAKLLDSWLFKGDTVEKSFKKIAELLASSKKRFLVIIDDVDRLTPEEALAIFRLIKSVGHLPNMTYLVVFDRDLAEKAVQERYPSEGPHFLEKIIQASFEVPSPLQVDLNNAVLCAIDEVCGPLRRDGATRTMNLFYDVVAPYITSPRHFTRFRSAISVTWPAIRNDVNVADFIALETLRLYEPNAFKAIRLRKSTLCGLRAEREGLSKGNGSAFEPYLKSVPEERHEQVRLALKRLFPRFENMIYSHEFTKLWDAERRICIEKHLETYLRLTLSDEALSSAKLDELVKRAGDQEFISQSFREAAQTPRKNGTSMVPVYLDELTTHALEVDRANVEPLLCAIFAIHDEIDLPQDAEKGFMAMANTTLRYHWLIRRLTRDRFNLDERTDLYTGALKTASFRWLIEFVSSAMGDYRNGDGELTQEENILVAKRAIDGLRERALGAIRTSASEGSLLHHPNLVGLLYRWRDFNNGDPSEVRAWTDGLLGDHRALIILVRRMTSESWAASMGFDGMGDRVATASIQVHIKDDMDILDTRAFRTSLEQIIAENTTDQEELDDLRSFIVAWDKERSGSHD